jgi:hypothetical protein
LTPGPHLISTRIAGYENSITGLITPSSFLSMISNAWSNSANGNEKWQMANGVAGYPPRVDVAVLEHGQQALQTQSTARA